MDIDTPPKPVSASVPDDATEPGGPALQAHGMLGNRDDHRPSRRFSRFLPNEIWAMVCTATLVVMAIAWLVHRFGG